MLPGIKARDGWKPPKTTLGEEAFLRHSNPSVSADCQRKMKSLPSWLGNASPATSHLGPGSASGQLVIVQRVWWLAASERQEKGKRSSNWAQIKSEKQDLKSDFRM